MPASRTKAVEPQRERVRLYDIVRDRVFGVLFVAEVQSEVGDQLARVALSVLVFDRTHSAAATALTYAATFLPAILGGVVLAHIGDRVPRRLVMVAVDLVRFVAFALMALPAVPIGVVLGLLVIAVFVGPAFAASQVSYLAGTMSPERFRAGAGVRMFSHQTAQVGGFALGGAAVAVLGTRSSLAVDAATFLVSAVAIRTLIPRDDVPAPVRRSPQLLPAHDAGSTERDSWLHTLVGLSWLAGFFVVPEGLAIPFAREIGATTTQSGLLLASIPFGSALGALLLVRWVPPARRESTVAAMAVCAGLPLVATAWHPRFVVAALAWAISGLLAAYQVEVISAVVQRVPADRRARSIGRISAGLVSAQGVGLAGFGAIAQWVGTAGAIALAGGCGAGAALVVLAAGWSSRPSRSEGHGRLSEPQIERTSGPAGQIGPIQAAGSSLALARVARPRPEPTDRPVVR